MDKLLRLLATWRWAGRTRYESIALTLGAFAMLLAMQADVRSPGF